MRRILLGFISGDAWRTKSTLELLTSLTFVTAICGFIGSMLIRQLVVSEHGMGVFTTSAGILFVLTFATLMNVPVIRALGRRWNREETPPQFKSAVAFALLADLLTVAAGLFVLLNTSSGPEFSAAALARLQGGVTFDQRVNEIRPRTQSILNAEFTKAGVQYPPTHVGLVAFKEERILQVYTASASTWKLVLSFPILAASGEQGPKLKEGDGQVPEGVYPIEWLNPNSRFHLSLRVGYPNTFDRKHAKVDGRTELGGDIMIHGGSASIGCIAIGDPAVEQLFLLAADVGIANMNILIVPCDLRHRAPSTPSDSPVWVADLYSILRDRLAQIPDSSAPK